MKHLSKRRLQEAGIAAAFLAICIGLVSLLTPYQPPPSYGIYDAAKTTQHTLIRAEVVRVSDTEVEARLLDGVSRGLHIFFSNTQDQTQQRVHTGSTVLLSAIENQEYVFYDTYRLPALVVLSVLFILAVLFTGRRHGLMSLAGLIASVLIIGGVTVPLLVHGWDAFWVTTGSAFLIAVVSVLLAHGLRRQTYISLGCILSVLLFVMLASALAVYVLGLSGIVDEVGYSLQESHSSINLSGILAGGIVIATLGALDDVVTTQVATVAQIIKADVTLSRRKVFESAITVGGEHIAALVNTLALVYVGASLPLVVIYSLHYDSVIEFLNSGFIATELTRTLIVSIGLVLSVPFSTWLATRLLVVSTRNSR